MQKRIWSQYNKDLVQRGSITFFIEEKTFQKIQNFRGKSTGGRPQEFPLMLIQLLLFVKIQYSLTYRSLEGFAKSTLQKMYGWLEVPSYSLICKRAKELSHSLPKLSSRRPTVVLIDASGIKVFGEGEWKRKIHGVGRPRKWLKIHIAVDETSQEIVAECLTDSSVADATMVDTLLESKTSVRVVKADGAYDRKCARDAAKKRKACLLAPPPKNARVNGTNQERDNAVLSIRGLGGDLCARSLWGRFTGYSYRALVETAFSRYKRLFGCRLFSKTLERQLVENRLKWVMLNKMRKVA